MTERGETALLSNNHNLGGSNLAATNDRILHAGSSKWEVNSTWVASLAGHVPLNPTASGASEGSRSYNAVDAAYAVLREGVRYDLGYGPELSNQCPAPESVEDAAVDKRVFKVGRTTGLRWGVVEAINAMLKPLFYPGLGECWFRDVMWVRSTDRKPFAREGDSGALVVDEEGGAVGLVFASDSQYTYVCPLGPALDGLGCRLLTRNGPVGP